MKPAPFSYHAPRTLAEALALQARLDNARVLAGGQSLVPMLNLRVAAPEHLIDLGGVAELAGIEEKDGGVAIGAMTSQRTIEKSPLVQARCPLLIEALAHVGHQQTRNRGTIGGSLCHLDPAAELPVAALALDATLTIAGRAGTRALPFVKFPAGYLTTALQPGEILTRIDIPALPPRTGWAFEEFARRHGDFAIVAVAALVTLAANGRVQQARVVIGGIGPAPIRVAAAEAALAGESWRDQRVTMAADAAAACPAEGDHNYPADYRQYVAGALTGRALGKAYARSRAAHG
jgi:carbon-monoxide dehydrogenase medium subunit